MDAPVHTLFVPELFLELEKRLKRRCFQEVALQQLPELIPVLLKR